MAAHDDKISTNRRRLFKALSAAPVVYTLDAGATGAGSSAYQCLVNDDGKISNWHHYNWPHIDNPCPSSGSEACYPYEYRNYVDTEEGVKSEQDCATSLHHVIIETGGDNSGVYHDFTNRPASVFLIDDMDNAGHKALLSDDRLKVCIKKIPVRRGLFAVVGHANEDNTAFTIDGIFPEYRIESGNGYRGIAGTCMYSIVGVTPQTLSRG